ncbi:MAG: S8 family peptidase [Hyphomicrobiaceae bacterium]
MSFTKALEAIPGLDLVGEGDTELEDENAPGYLYLLIPTEAAIREMLGLWRLWQANKPLGQKYKAWERLFICLHDLRRWGPKDRVSDEDARLIADIAAFDPNVNVRVEIELVFERDAKKAMSQRDATEASIVELGGRKLDEARLDEIAYDALLVEVSAAKAEAIARRDPAGLAGLPDVYAIRPQSKIDVTTQFEDAEEPVLAIPAPSKPAIAAILDGVPVANHPAFLDHVELVDPDGLEAIAIGQRWHGTAMTSLIVRGDLKRAEAALDRAVVCRPIMYAHLHDQAEEIFAPEELLVDTFVRAVKDLREGESAAAQGIFIINVSLGDRNRPFFGRTSAWARAIDWLAHHYGVLFIVSAGNADGRQHDIELKDIANNAAFKALGNQQRTEAVLAGIHAGIRHRRILSPAEAVNALTVGALHEDAIREAPNKGYSLDPFPTATLPTPSSRVGPGVGNAIKPDILMPGGRLRVTSDQASTPAIVRVTPANRFGGLQVASPRLDATGVAISSDWSGATSGAAALATRAAHQIHDALEVAYPGEYGPLSLRHKALLVKALLAHRARVPEDGREIIERVFGPIEPKLHARRASNVFKMLGLGVPQLDETVACLQSRATLWGTGFLAQDDARIFTLPLPACLSDHRGHRLLSVTVTWFTPVTPGRRAYRSVRLTVEEPTDAQLKVFVTGATPFQADRKRVERGTIFQRSWEGSSARKFNGSPQFELRVARKLDPFDDLPDTVDFAIAASLEATDQDLQIYEQVLEPLQVKPAVSIPVAVRPQG